MVFAKLARGTKLTCLPTGHIARCIAEFPGEGRRCPVRLRAADYRVDPYPERRPISVSAYKRAAVRRSVSETSGSSRASGGVPSRTQAPSQERVAGCHSARRDRAQRSTLRAPRSRSGQILILRIPTSRNPQHAQ
eukprot:1020821-Alexandrium_andersonii.AAC.1